MCDHYSIYSQRTRQRTRSVLDSGYTYTYYITFVFYYNFSLSLTPSSTSKLYHHFITSSDTNHPFSTTFIPDPLAYLDLLLLGDIEPPLRGRLGEQLLDGQARLCGRLGDLGRPPAALRLTGGLSARVPTTKVNPLPWSIKSEVASLRCAEACM